jgi:hypothetical protein
VTPARKACAFAVWWSVLAGVACRAPEAPAASGRDLDGAPVDPLAGGEVATVLLFVQTGCPISNRYAPTIGEIAAAYRERGVASWLVYPDPDDDAASIREHVASFAIDVPALRDPEHALVARAGARVTPEAAVFARGQTAPAYRGRIDDRVVEFGKVRAEPSTHDLRDALDAVLDGRAPAAATTKAVGCYISDLE